MSGDSATLEVLGTAELDLITRDLTREVEARTGLLAVSDHTGEVAEVLGARGDALDLDDLPVSLTGGFASRVLCFERATLEPFGRNGSDVGARAPGVGR